MKAHLLEGGLPYPKPNCFRRSPSISLRTAGLITVARTLFVSVIAALLFVINVAEAEPFRIGISLALTGEGGYTEPAEMQRRGYRLWEKDVNKRGGLMGRNVQILIEDDRGDANEVRRIYSTLIKDHEVDMTFGPYSSALTIAAAAVVAEHNSLMVAAGAAAVEVWDKGYRNVFGLYTPASRYSKGMLELALDRGLTGVAIIHEDDPFSKAAADGTRKWAGEYGLTIVMFEKIEKGRRDLSYLARAAREKSAELIVVAGHFDASVDMRSALSGIDWYPRAYYATIGPALPRYDELLGSDAALTFSTSFWHPESNIPGSKKFDVDFSAEHGTDPSYQAAAAFAAGQVLEEAVKLANSLDRDRIGSALYELDVETIFGRYAVDRTGMQMKQLALIIQWQHDKRVIVWPKGYRTVEPRFE